jgi:hypothetical protein
MRVVPAAAAVAVGLLLRYAAPIPEGLTDQVSTLCSWATPAGGGQPTVTANISNSTQVARTA